jgi:hypothetical protein
VQQILSRKVCVQGEKHSKVEHLARISNAESGLLSQNRAMR